MCINKSQTVLVDLSPLQLQLQTSRTYFDIILTSMRARPRQVGNPGTTHSAVVPPSTMPPKHSLDGATEPFTHRTFYTQKLLHTGAFTHRCFYTQTLLHTDAFTQTLFTHRSTILPQFSTIKLHFVRKGCRGPVKIAILLQFFPRAPAKGSS